VTPLTCALRTALLGVVSLPLAAQQASTPAPPPPYRVTWAGLTATAGAGLATALPAVLGLPRGAPPCAPCDPAGLPGIDRWAVGYRGRTAAPASDVLLAGVAVFGGAASVLGVSAERARGDAAVYISALGWTGAATEWLKVAVHRSRPVLYGSDAVAAAHSHESRMSFPSGHTSMAFAAATSYLVMARRQHLPHAGRNAALLYAGAAGVGVLRVAAGRHFPTDVAAGAILGTGVGWLVAHLHR
jgi:membrane-associated phospholipid phosphatase